MRISTTRMQVRGRAAAFDMIFCRNVLTCFDKDRTVYRRGST
ncbi:MAG: hypothetical protein DIU62_000295 [Pseudomonadota bacterium]|jgi:chemotaxis methyl-accepting protein methylase